MLGAPHRAPLALLGGPDKACGQVVEVRLTQRLERPLEPRKAKERLAINGDDEAPGLFAVGVAGRGGQARLLQRPSEPLLGSLEHASRGATLDDDASRRPAS